MERLLCGHTREEWQLDLMRMRDVISYHNEVMKTAREKKMPDVLKRAGEHVDAMARLCALTELILDNYWQDAEKVMH